MNTNMNANYQQSPNQPHINYDAVDQINARQVQAVMDEQKAENQKPARKGKTDWLPLIIAAAVVVIAALVLVLTR